MVVVVVVVVVTLVVAVAVTVTVIRQAVSWEEGTRICDSDCKKGVGVWNFGGDEVKFY